MSNEIFNGKLNFLWQRVIELTLHDESDLKAYEGKLYHYTSSHGLVGIFQSQKLWATESLYLNDSTEIQYGLKLAEDLINSKLELGVSKEVAQALSLIKTKIYDNLDEIYIACLSENGDLLSQWKGYGSYGSGYSIELESNELLRTKRKFPFVNILVKRVIYDKHAQNSLLLRELDFAIGYLSDLVINFPDKVQGSVAAIASTTAYYLKTNAICFKDEAFSEEQEWRIFYRNSQSSEEGYQEPKFRVTDDSIIPYLELDIAPSAQKQDWTLPISKVIVGSKLDFERSKKSIDMLTNLKGISHLKVVKSKVPLR